MMARLRARWATVPTARCWTTAIWRAARGWGEGWDHPDVSWDVEVLSPSLLASFKEATVHQTGMVSPYPIFCRQRRSLGIYYDQGPNSKVAVCCTCWLKFVTHPTHVGVGCSRVGWLKSNNKVQIDTISSVVTWSPFISSVSCDYPENDPQWPDLKSKVALKSHQFTIARQRFRFPIPNRHGRHWDVKVTLPRPSEWRARSCSSASPSLSQKIPGTASFSLESPEKKSLDANRTAEARGKPSSTRAWFPTLLKPFNMDRSFWTIPTTDLYYYTDIYQLYHGNSNFWGLETTLPLGMAMFFLFAPPSVEDALFISTAPPLGPSNSTTGCCAHQLDWDMGNGQGRLGFEDFNLKLGSKEFSGWPCMVCSEKM